MSVRKKSIKLSTNLTESQNQRNGNKMKEVFYLKKVRPRDLTENFGAGSAYLINNYNKMAEL